MRVVLLSEFFLKNMGYLENLLPKYLARLGAETHVIATDLSPSYRQKSSNAANTGSCEQLQAGTIEVRDGFTLHILGHKRVVGYMRMVGLRKKLWSIRPDIVQTVAAAGWIPLDAALSQPLIGYRLFTGCHMAASVFPLAGKNLPWWNRERLACLLSRTVPGRFTSLFAEKCYGATSDCADVAVRFYGVPQDKINVCPLGVDVELFSPIANEEEAQARLDLRRRLGFLESEIVCIYTGRFTEDKNPLLLARAIAQLVRRGEPFRGLFVGNGVQAQEIGSCPGCVIHPYVPVQDLSKFFRAADIGAWPTQESMSMLDAAACGLPIIVNHTLAARERIEGNGLTYRLNDVEDLIRVLLLLRDSQTRQHLGRLGALKMARDFSWETIAKQRLRDYRAVLSSNGVPAAQNGKNQSDEGAKITSASDTISQ
jgi:glycosyltransferase involved in cell wall biosynthesis